MKKAIIKAPRPRHIGDLVADPHNRRTHSPRNVEMIAAALRSVGAARSIVIDEGDGVLAGNGVLEGAALAGITKLQIVEADGDTIIAVRRRGLSEEQKRALAIYDNRTAELAEWNIDQLSADQRDGLELASFFFDDELAALWPAAAGGGKNASLADRFGVPPFSVLDARQGYWQDRKRAWLLLGIESELGRGEDVSGGTQASELLAHSDRDEGARRKGRRPNATPGGSALPGVRGPRKHYKPGKGKRPT